MLDQIVAPMPGVGRCAQVELDAPLYRRTMGNRGAPSTCLGLLGFGFANNFDQAICKALLVRTIMRPAVAVWADTDDEANVVRSSIAQAPNVVSFKVGTAMRGYERGRIFACLAIPLCALEDIVAHVAAALVDRSHRLSWLRLGWSTRSNRSPTQLLEINAWGRRLSDVIRFQVQLPQGRELENDSLPLLTIHPILRLELPAGTGEQSLKANGSAAGFLREDEQVFAILSMITNRSVAADHEHVTVLALPGVPEGAVVLVPVLVANQPGTVTRENEDAGRVCGSRYATLLLTAEAAVDVFATIVVLVNDERPMHPKMMHGVAVPRKVQLGPQWCNCIVSVAAAELTLSASENAL